MVIVKVEITQNEETSKPESSPPERPGDPVIEIAIFPGGWIITNDRRSVFIIILLNLGGVHIFGNLRRRSGGAFSIFGT